ncbi:MAG: hypothetical protein GY935_27590 [Gammaproteobacteria bacterium]|nr:hypothetical protein [Gammaproteobacteria bacterium]
MQGKARKSTGKPVAPKTIASVMLAVRKGLLWSPPLLHCYPAEAAAIADSMYSELAMEADSVTNVTL